MTTILLVDDEVDFITLFAETLERMGFECYTCHSVKAAKEILSNQNKIDAIITDINLQSGLSGLDLIRYVADVHSDIPIAVASAYTDSDASIEALKLGAFDYITKPIDQERLKLLLDKLDSAAKQNASFRTSGITDNITSELIGNSEIIQKVKQKILKIARTQAPVFISGESGSGKEVVAKLVHKASNRSEAPFIPINCGAIPSDLIESVLFGYKKGSFTGADKDSLGLIRSADGGTLFLDEIAELPLSLQVKLLRVVQEKKVRPVGSDKEYTADFRIISATHRDLKALVEDGKFRADLFFRIFVMDINLPPLRDRGGDIILLAEYFCKKICDDWDVESKTLTQNAKNWLLNQRFTGNVRELHNIMERAITLSETPELDVVDLSESSVSVEHLEPPVAQNLSQHSVIDHKVDEMVASESACENENSDLYIPESEGLEAYLGGLEKNILLKVLHDAQGNKTLAAKRLGITFRSIRYRLKKYDIDSDDEAEVEVI